MKAAFPLLLLLAAVISRGPSHANACGSPDIVELGPLRPVDHLVARMRYPGDPLASWSNQERGPFRFLHPFRIQQPKAIEPLWRFSYQGIVNLPAPTTTVMDDAMAKGDWKRAATAAQVVVDELLAMPPVPAADHRDLLLRCVELIELSPHLTGIQPTVAASYFANESAATWPAVLQLAHQVRSDPASATHANNPRRATLEWLQIRRDFATTVPDGWSGTARKNVTKSEWNRLHKQTEQWLLAHLQHPLRDLVVLHQVRIHYFAGTYDDAWTILIDLLPRRTVRALAEMRYLLLMGQPPTDTMIDGLTNPRMITALTTPKRVTLSRFKRWWKLAAQHRPQPWAINLQERLLLWAALDGSLPASLLPKEETPPSELWGKLRAAVLMKRGAYTAANSQLALVNSDGEQAQLAAHAFLKRNRHVKAASVDALDPGTIRYVIEVLMSDRKLEQLATQGSPTTSRLARVEQGVRLTAKGRWDDAAKRIEDHDRSRAALWRKAGTLAKAKSANAELELARFLEANRGRIFHPIDNGWYRGLSYRHATLVKSNAPEARRIRTHFERTNERWRALGLTTRWLENNRNASNARTVLGEADRYYNRLINLGGGDYYFWGRHAKTSPSVAALRRVGRDIRAIQ